MNREPVRQLWFDFAQAEYDLFHANSTRNDPTQDVQILERALNCENMFKALARVEHNGGSPGIDGVTVEDLRGTLREVWPKVRQSLLDGLDKELEQRGHRFVRYADDCNIYVASRRGGNRVMASLTRFLDRRLKLQVNVAKSSVDRPWNRKFLGFSFTRWDPRRKISLSAIKRFKDRIREITTRTRGRSLRMIIEELRNYLNGWLGYFGFTEARSVFKELDSWIRRRLRSYVLKQWGRRGYKELRKRGVDAKLAWNTAKSAHGPWRLSRSPALTIALGFQYFTDLGLPHLYKKTLW